MATDKVDYAVILADAEAKKAALEAYIISLRNALAMGALGQSGDISIEPSTGSLSMGGASVELPVGAFLNKSVPAAIKLYLSAVRKKQTTEQIAAALKEGGIETTASNFLTVVAGSLHRLKIAKEVLRFKDGWGFADHYPEHIRKGISQESKPARKKPKKTAKAKGKKVAVIKASIVVPITEGLEHRIEKFLNSDKNKPFSAVEIAGALGANSKAVSMMLGRMAVKNKAEKCDGGTYRAVSEKIQKAG